MHALDAVDALAKFNRRRERFLRSAMPILCKMDDRDGFDDALGQLQEVR